MSVKRRKIVTDYVFGWSWPGETWQDFTDFITEEVWRLFSHLADGTNPSYQFSKLLSSKRRGYFLLNLSTTSDKSIWWP